MSGIYNGGVNCISGFNVGVVMFVDVFFAGAMATFTAYAERDFCIAIVGIFLVRCVAVVAVHAIRYDRPRKARIVGVITRTQVPDFALAIPGDGHFIQESIFIDEIGSIVIARSDDIGYFAGQFVNDIALLILSIFALIKEIAFAINLVIEVSFGIIDGGGCIEIFNNVVG